MSTVQCGPIRLRGDSIKAGAVVIGHGHKFAHMTYIPMGAIKFEKLESKDGPTIRTVIKRAGLNNFILIEKDVWHRLTAIEDSVYHCIYALRDAAGDIADEMSEHDGWEADYA